MERIKRSLLIAFCLLWLLSLSGCIWIPVTEKPLKLYGDSPVVSVVLYQLENGIDIEVEGDVLNLDEESEPAAVLPEDQIEDFCNRLQKLKFRNDIIIILAAMDPPAPIHQGNLIRVNYENGNYEIICSTQTFYWNGKENGTRASYDKEDWDAFLAEYFPEHIANS